MRTVVVGATRNFFKVGHATFRVLHQYHPEIDLRLAIPDITDAARAIRGIDVELRAWEPADPGSLLPAIEGCSTMLMVPPIDGRVRAANTYIEAARRAGIEYILCLGVQHRHGQGAMAEDVAIVDELLARSDIAHDTVRLPLFLENLLYQVPTVATASRFAYPVDPDAPFCFAACADLAELFACLLTSPERGRPVDKFWTASTSLTCRGWAEALSQATGRTVWFERQDRDEFTAGLRSKGMSERAAGSVLELWDLIDAGLEPAPTTTLAELLRRPPTTAEAWSEQHACCFGPGWSDCPHPKPPHDHMSSVAGRP